MVKKSSSSKLGTLRTGAAATGTGAGAATGAARRLARRGGWRGAKLEVAASLRLGTLEHSGWALDRGQLVSELRAASNTKLEFPG